MRILNVTNSCRMICLRTSNIIIHPYELSNEFKCNDRVFKKLIETPNYQNCLRFVINSAERQLSDVCMVIPGVIIPLQDAINLSNKLKNGYVLPKMDIKGRIIDEPTKKPEVESNEVESEVDTEVVESKLDDSEKPTESSEVPETETKKFKFVKHSTEWKLSKAKSFEQMRLDVEGYEDVTVKLTSSNVKVAIIVNDNIVKLVGKGKSSISASLINKDNIEIAADTYQLKVN